MAVAGGVVPTPMMVYGSHICAALYVLFGGKVWRRGIMRRVEQDELLDTGYGSEGEVRASLDDLWRINRYLGGIRALTVHLDRRLWGQARTVLDIGSGSGEIAALIAARYPQCRVMALDNSRRHLVVAREKVGRSVMLVQADAGHLPFGANSVDYVVSSLFLHHLGPDAVAGLLRRAYEIARCGVVMSDLVRGRVPLMAFRCITPLVSPITRHDGAVSVRRAYTVSEMRELAARAGLRHGRVRGHPMFRMTLTVDKPS